MTRPAVRLLGPVAVHGADGRLMDLGPARQRAVLAALLVDAGRPVSASQLIRRVWGDCPPPAVDQALRSYLCRLRRIIDQATPVRLERRNGGYLAAVDDDELDLTLFRGLAGRARVAVRDGRLTDALSELARALALADGAPLTGVGSDWLDEQRRLLDRELLAVTLERNDLALATGAPGLVVADAVARLSDEPYDERVAGQAVLALAGVGRTAEALEVFQQVRQRLADELGMDPSPALRDIHQRVLRGLESVRVPAAVESLGAGSVVPRHLPPTTRCFVDRARESHVLDQLLVDDGDAPAVVVISGPGGAGKTALAVHWAQQRSERFPDGQLYVDFHGFDLDRRPTTPESAIRVLLTALGVDPGAIPTELPDMVGAYRSLLAGRRVLLVADDVGSAEQVRLLLPPGRGSAAVVTSRTGLASLATTAGAQVLPLGLFDDSAALELLTRRLGRTRTTAEPAAIERLLRQCGGLPLALAIVAGRAAAVPSLSLAALADEPADDSRSLATFSGGECRTDLDAVVAGSVATLTTAATAILQWLSAGPRIRIRTAAVAALADIGESQAEAALRELLAIHLLEPDGPHGFRLHDLVRLAVRSRPVRGLEDAVDRLLLFLSTERPGPMADADDLLTAATYARESGRDTAACDLASALEVPLGSAGRWSDLVTVNEWAVCAAARVGDERRRAVALIGRGRGRIGLREFVAADADLTAALAAAEQVADLGLRARAHRAMARLGAHQHRWDAALHHDECGLTLHRRRGDVLGEAHALNAIGWHLAHLGRAEEALDSCRSALMIFVAHDDREGQALTQDSIGYALDQLDRGRESCDAYRRGAALCRELGWLVVLANTLLRLADVAERVADDHGAAAARTEAAEILRLSGRQILEP